MHNNSVLRNSTLLFLIKSENDTITEICLAMKKRGFGKGRYNGAGGKVESGEGIEHAVIREVEEEIGVKVKEMNKCAELTFNFPHNPAFDQLVHVYFSSKWEGDISESEEMKPKWFLVKDIPYEEMWPDDIFWLPKVIDKKQVHARFVFGEGDFILEKEVHTTSL